MAKKLGKKAKKFAKKNLQSVMKRKRKLNSMHFRRKSTSCKDKENVPDDHEVKVDQQAEGISEGVTLDGAVYNNDLDSLFADDDDDDHLNEDFSDSDGYLTEDPECPYISGSENEDETEGKNDDVDLLRQNSKLLQEIANQKSKLAKLRKKDPSFSEYLESRRSDLSMSGDEESFSDEEDDATNSDQAAMRQSHASHGDKALTSSTVDVWCWLVTEQPDGPALPNLLNAFRAACHFDEISSQRIPKRKIFSKILTFVLSEADAIFRRLLGISVYSCKETIVKLTKKSEWKTVRPLIKSYLRSSLFLLNQETDNQILIFVLSQLRLSCIFFAAFPTLAKRLLKISVRLWATGDQSLSSSSYLVIRDIASHLSSDCLDSCLSRTYNVFISHCKFVETTDSDHLEFLLNSVVELYSLHIQESYQKVLSSVQQLASILRLALNKKKKEELQKIQSWQYINCTRLWVKFISSNCQEHDLQPLLFLIIQVVRGIAHLFPGPRYLPLRFQCVKMLNQLSVPTGVFIPVASLVFDCLEMRGINSENKKQGEHANFSSVLQVPKQMLKSRTFHEQCVLTAIELLSVHFAQWSYHISFPELATIPLILLKRFHERSTLESVRRPIRRLIDQVQQNNDFIQRKRDEVSFSPKDRELADSFLQLEKIGGNAPFTQYYRNILKSSHLQNMVSCRM